MRTLKDRIRHTVTFELIALLIVALIGSRVTGQSVAVMGTLSIMFSVLVMAWNLLYNWLFDLWEQRYRDSTKRGVRIRIVHATLFEAVLLIVGVFLVAWWLDMTLLNALVLDIGFALFFIAYAFAFNWVYDIVFPIPQQN